MIGYHVTQSLDHGGATVHVLHGGLISGRVILDDEMAREVPDVQRLVRDKLKRGILRSLRMDPKRLPG